MSKKPKPPLQAQTVSFRGMNSDEWHDLNIEKGATTKDVGRTISFHMGRTGDTLRNLNFQRGHDPEHPGVESPGFFRNNGPDKKPGTGGMMLQFGD